MEIRVGYKKTEVGVIPEDWKITKLSEVIEVNRSIRYGIVQPGRFEPNGCLMLRSQDYSKGWSNSDEMHRVNAALENQYKNARLNKDDLIMTVVGAGIGQVVIAPDWLDKAIVSRSTARIAIDKTKAAKEYILCCLTSPFGVRQILDAQKEGAQPVISCLDLAKFNIPYPSLKEQTAIATALSDADALISSLEKLIAKKRNIKQGAMQKLLQPKKGWEVKKLGEMAEFITKGTTPTSLGKDFQTSGIKFIKIESLTSTGEIIPDKVAYIDESTHQLLKRSQLKCGDILFSIAGALGRVAIVNNEILPANTNQALAIIRLNINCEIELKYLFIYLTSIKIQTHILNVSVQGAQANLSLLNISQLLIEVPTSKVEQNHIANILSDMDAEIGALQTKLEKYRKVKLGMMQNLLTGKIRLV